MTKIVKNIIQCPRVDKIKSIILFEQAAQAFNEGVISTLQEQKRNHGALLKDTHKTLFQLLVNSLNYQLMQLNNEIKLNHVINTEEEQSILTNRSRLAGFLGCSKNTVTNRLNRLEEAGIIRTISHGPIRDQEIFITPKFLVYRSLASKYQKTTFIEIPELSVGKTQSLLPLLCNKQEHLNNKIIPVEKVKSNDFDNALPSDTGINRNINKNTGQCNLSAENTSDYLRKLQKQEQNLRAAAAAYALWFISYAFDKLGLWKNRKDGRTVFAAEFEKAKQYVIENYFSDCTSLYAMEQRQTMFQWRLEAIKRYKDKNNYDLQFPSQFLDINNKRPGSFANTLGWWKKNNEFKSFKQKQKLRSVAERKVTHAAMVAAKDLTQYKNQEAYIRHNAPHMLDDFYRKVNSLFAVS